MSPRNEVAVLAEDLHEQFGARFYCYHEQNCPEPGQTYKRCEKSAEQLLATLAAAGIRCLYVPEGVEVEHGARLVEAPFDGDFYIEAP